MTLKKIMGKIHLFLGLFSGIIIFIVAVTGAIYAFEEEIRSLYEKDLWYVEVAENPVRISLSKMKEAADKAFFMNTPGTKKITHEDARFFSNPKRSQSFVYYTAESLIYKQVFVNPYTGKVIHVKNLATDAFIISLELHRNLLLGAAGKEIIDYACLTFLILLISGIYLWWPRNCSAKKKRFKIKWGPNPKKNNYDLHNVLGFYASIIGLILVLTGLVWAFTWYADGVDWIANGGESTEAVSKFTSDTLYSPQGSKKNTINKVFNYAHREKKSKRFYIEFPKTKHSPVTLISYQSDQVYYDHRHVYFDQYSGEVLKDHPYDEATNGEKIIGMAYDIHIGKILGLPGQILAFSGSIIIASLPITGFIIWIGRRKRKRNGVF